jgi:hypothetical protein
LQAGIRRSRVVFKKVVRDPIDFNVDRDLLNYPPDFYYDALVSYRTDLTAVVPCTLEAGDQYAQYNSRFQMQETASVSKDAAEVVIKDLKEWAPHHDTTLTVLVPERNQATAWDYYAVNPNNLPYEPAFLQLGYVRDLALLWAAPAATTTGLFNALGGSDFPVCLRTIYLLNMTRPEKMTAQDLRRLRVANEPWFGHRFAFVDLEDNEVNNLDAYFLKNGVDDWQISRRLGNSMMALNERRIMADPFAELVQLRVLTAVQLA